MISSLATVPNRFVYRSALVSRWARSVRKRLDILIKCELIFTIVTESVMLKFELAPARERRRQLQALSAKLSPRIHLPTRRHLTCNIFLALPPNMPQQHTTISPLSTFLIATCFLLALFPSTFVSIVWAPYNSLVNYAFPLPPHRESVLCTSPNICVAAPTMSWYALSQICLNRIRY
jgi:hypothetical protein